MRGISSQVEELEDELANSESRNEDLLLKIQELENEILELDNELSKYYDFESWAESRFPNILNEFKAVKDIERNVE